jgi:hypothetical protein
MQRTRPWKALAPLAVLALALGAGSAHGQTAGGQARETIPDDARLGPVRAALQATVDDAGAAGLPTRPRVVKVREGLAKGVPADRIAAAVQSLARGLEEANRFARAQGRRAPSPALLVALADLHGRGVGWDSATPLLAARADDAALARAVDVLAELAERGYPERRAGQLLREVQEHDPGAMNRVVASLESIRRGLTVSRADALDALDANLSIDGTALDAAVNKSMEGREHSAAAGNGRGNGQANEHAAGASKKGLAKGMK